MPRIVTILKFLLVEILLLSFVFACLGLCILFVPEQYRIFCFPLGGLIGWFLMHISHSKTSRFKPYCDRIVRWTFKMPNENPS